MRSNGVAPSGHRRWRCRLGQNGCGYSTTAPSSAVRNQRGDIQDRPRVMFKRTLRKDSRRVIVTAAQNATPVHGPFLAALETAADYLGAELIVIPLRYKNPTSRWTASQANDETWDAKVVPYLCNTRVRLGPNLVVLGDVKTQPTAVRPLTGFEAMTHGESSILGHTKLQLTTVPTPQNALPKILTTTGAVTKPNYTDSKAGKLGAFHHTLGAALVEWSGRTFHLRQINADSDGSFYDLDVLYRPGSVTTGHRASALVMGDTHVDFIARHVERATFGADGIVERLQPSHLVWNDLLDGYACNPHHRGNPFAAVAKARSGRGCVRSEVERALEFLRTRTQLAPDCRSVVVPSNHNDFLTRWVFNTDWRADPANARFYLETALAMLDGTDLTTQGTEFPDPFTYWLRKGLGDDDRFVLLRRGDSFTIAGVEVALHGDMGPHGSKGSLHNLRRIGVRSVIGHSHAPGIDEGAMQVGTSTELVLEYSRGAPSGWLNSHAVIYPNGKRSLINIINGRWKL